MAREKEYCYKIVFSASYICYIGNAFGRYHVFATDSAHSYNYSIYGGYTRIGDASRKLEEIDKNNTLKWPAVRSLYYMSKEKIDTLGAFWDEEV